MAQESLVYLSVFFMLVQELKTVALLFDLKVDLPVRAGKNCLKNLGLCRKIEDVGYTVASIMGSYHML